MRHWKEFAQILDNGIWDRFFKIFPEQLTEEQFPRLEATLLLIFSEKIPQLISQRFEYYNAFFVKIMDYLFAPVETADLNNQLITACTLGYMKNLHQENPLQLNKLRIMERLLTFLTKTKKEDLYVAVVEDIYGIIGEGEALDEYAPVRRPLVRELLAALERREFGNENEKALLEFMFMFCEASEHYTELLLENDQFVKSVFKRYKCRNVKLGILLYRGCSRCPELGMKCFMKYNFMKPLLFTSGLITLGNQFGSVEFVKLIEGLLQEAECLVDGSEYLYNPIALQIEECKGVPILKNFELDDDRETADLSKELIEKYFGENWETYLARRRGLKTKKAK